MVVGLAWSAWSLLVDELVVRSYPQPLAALGKQQGVEALKVELQASVRSLSTEL